MKPYKSSRFNRVFEPNRCRLAPSRPVEATIRYSNPTLSKPGLGAPNRPAPARIAPVFVPAMRKFLRRRPGRVGAGQPADTGTRTAGAALDRVGQDRGQQRRLVRRETRGRPAEGIFSTGVDPQLTGRPKLGHVWVNL